MPSKSKSPEQERSKSPVAAGVRWLNKDAARRLIVSVLAAGLAFIALPRWISSDARLLGMWNIGTLCFLLLVFSKIARVTPAETGRTVGLQDQSNTVMLGIVVAAASASLLAIGLVLGRIKTVPLESRAGLLALAVMAVATSWLMTHSMFALHYAHRYYGDHYQSTKAADRGLHFPGNAPPNYMDFIYFSFVIGMTAQVSDVQVASRPMRRLVWLHSMLSFLFYTVILALTINVVASSL